MMTCLTTLVRVFIQTKSDLRFYEYTTSMDDQVHLSTAENYVGDQY